MKNSYDNMNDSFNKLIGKMDGLIAKLEFFSYVIIFCCMVYSFYLFQIGSTLEAMYHVLISLFLYNIARK